MGKRVLQVTPAMFVDLCKGQGDKPFTMTVDNPLPSDAKLIGVDWDTSNNIVRLIVQSPEWDVAQDPYGGYIDLYPSPSFTAKHV
jgi:hypothetical protein